MTIIKFTKPGNLFLITCSIFFSVSHSQILMKDAINIKGITFKETVAGVISQGYLIDKIDSNYKTITTEWKTLASDWMGLNAFRIWIKVNDSMATLTGQWKSKPQSNSKYTRQCFDEMNKLAESYQKPIEIKRQ